MTRACRLLVVGPSGSGTTTLGRVIADRWAVPHADVDDYFWLPTSPPYTTQRPVEDRLALMRAIFVPRDTWVLSGSLDGWGDPVIEQVGAVVFVTLDRAVRRERLRGREARRYGDGIAPGGPRELAHRAFVAWAMGYDDECPGEGRSRMRHEKWLAGLPCPVLRVDGADPVAELADEVTAWVEVTSAEGVRTAQGLAIDCAVTANGGNDRAENAPEPISNPLHPA